MARKAKEPVNIEELKKEVLHFVPMDKYPEDYHTDVLEEFFKGELKRKDGSYYKQTERNKYYPNRGNHLCPGHWQGYRFLIQQYCPEGGIVFDPCTGSGTAGVESVNNGRNFIGIELEYPEVARENIGAQLTSGDNGLYWQVNHGDMRNIDEILKHLGPIEFDLVVTGAPYNNNSDAPERKDIYARTDNSFDYNKELPNFAFMKDKEYFEEIHRTYAKICEYLKVGGYFAIIIKDPMRRKQPYLLHKLLSDEILKIPGMEMEAIYIHQHLPRTLFMNTYLKRYPEVKKFSWYQTMVVFKKVE